MDNQKVKLSNSIIEEISWEIADTLANYEDVLLDPGNYYEIIFHKLHERFSNEDINN